MACRLWPGCAERHSRRGNDHPEHRLVVSVVPGKRTEEYLNGVLSRITLVGAVFLGLVAMLPVITRDVGDQVTIISSTGLLIVVGVVLDTMKQLEAQLLMRQYEGFIK